MVTIFNVKETFPRDPEHNSLFKLLMLFDLFNSFTWIILGNVRLVLQCVFFFKSRKFFLCYFQFVQYPISMRVNQMILGLLYIKNVIFSFLSLAVTISCSILLWLLCSKHPTRARVSFSKRGLVGHYWKVNNSQDIWE